MRCLGWHVVAVVTVAAANGVIGRTNNHHHDAATAAFVALSSPAMTTRRMTTTTTRPKSSRPVSDNNNRASPLSLLLLTKQSVEQSVANLKKVLEREYVSFFDPMRTEYYSPSVTFDDPLTSLTGVDQYRNNVDMLASRTLLGRLLFQDASITLFNVVGGQVEEEEEKSSGAGGGIAIRDIVTRWSLRVTAQILPWKPTARFTGVSVYGVVPSTQNKEGVQIVSQVDYWDSVNLRPDSSGDYQTVDKGMAVSDFLGQLRPSDSLLGAPEAGPELPYELLRRGNGYEVRRYPAFCAAQIPYNRRDEGFGTLGAFTRGMNPLSPAIMQVPQNNDSSKSMFWPLLFAPPGQSGEVAPPPQATTKAAEEAQFRSIQLQSFPRQVIAVGSFNDAALEPVVRKADAALRTCLQRDGLTPAPESAQLLRFAQYDAVYSLGKRRGEVWIQLDAKTSPW